MERKNETFRRKQLIIADIPITVEYRKVKNINLYVKPPGGEVLITAPPRTSIRRIEEFAASKRNWILHHQERIRKKQEGSSLEGNRQIHAVTQEQVEHMTEKIREYAEKWERIMGVHASRWTIRDMKTRWGSCTVDTGAVRLNRRLAAYPEECLEYVIVHELCHLIEPSHNKRFKDYMTRFLPDWKERKGKLL